MSMEVSVYKEPPLLVGLAAKLATVFLSINKSRGDASSPSSPRTFATQIRGGLITRRGAGFRTGARTPDCSTWRL
jgi:hypothetical protein